MKCMALPFVISGLKDSLVMARIRRICVPELL